MKKIIVIVLLLLLVFPASLFANAVPVDHNPGGPTNNSIRRCDNSSGSNTNTCTGATMGDPTITLTAGVTCVAFAYSFRVNVSAITTTYNGTTLTHAGGVSIGASRTEMYFMSSPPTGAADALHVQWTTSSDIDIWYQSWSGTDTSNCVNLSNVVTGNDGGTAGTPTITITTASTSGVFAAASQDGSNWTGGHTGGTLIGTDDTTFVNSASSYDTGTGGTYSWALGGTSTYTTMAIEIVIPSGGGGSAGVANKKQKLTKLGVAVQ